ncbi:MAG: hypothetical protein JWO08_2327 [Verrucomicrobiaceae bacterium]|nr:hypothetical protein [Verrucomicrobiaceae bacterium]
MKRSVAAVVVLAIAVGAVGLWWSAELEPVVLVPAPPSVAVAAPSKRVSVASPSPSIPVVTPALRFNPPSLELATQLNAPGGDPARDVILLHQILSQYQRALQSRQGTPIGDDVDLARALKGHNPMRLAFLPPTHSALAGDGHLLDRWGTPYHLHPRGKGAFEVRSAGPDGKLHTKDDFVANPPRERP